MPSAPDHQRWLDSRSRGAIKAKGAKRELASPELDKTPAWRLKQIESDKKERDEVMEE
jgi:hypothetical protein